jgi:hypothetical protein
VELKEEKMSSITITEKETLYTIHCAHCHMMFAITRDFEERRRSDRTSFYCPSGHSQWFQGITDKERAKRAEARAQALRDQLDASERSRAALKGVATKMKAKVEKAEAGVCPHCHRSFQDLRRHMKSKHLSDVASSSSDDGQ